jgi:hypothetical protein
MLKPVISLSRYLVIDGLLNGTGVRDYYSGGYISPRDLGLSDALCEQISTWLEQYEAHHYYDYQDEVLTQQLDQEGIGIAQLVKQELGNVKVQYYSDALVSTISIE